MYNGPRTNRGPRRTRSGAQFAGHSKRWSANSARPDPQASHSARRNYERYLALADAEARAGNRIGAENYYQHAENFFRSMSSDPNVT
jgi:hypothetical protein